MKILMTTAVFLLGMSLAWAQNMPVGGSSPVKVHANSMQYYGNENKSTFRGKVVAVSEEYTLTADEVDVFFETIDNQSEITQILCRGNVNFKSTDMLAVSNNAELDQPTKMIKLRGNAKIWQNENYLEGEEVDIQYETKEIFVDKGTSDRVTIIFNSSDNVSLP